MGGLLFARGVASSSSSPVIYLTQDTDTVREIRIVRNKTRTRREDFFGLLGGGGSGTRRKRTVNVEYETLSSISHKTVNKGNNGPRNEES